MNHLALALGAAVLASPALAQTASPALIAEEAAAAGVPNALAQAVIRVESTYRCSARNSGSLGVGQVKPRTARSVGVVGNLFDCRTGARAAMRYLRAAIVRGGAGCAGVSLYNMGVYARPRCTAYGRRVMALVRR